MEYDEEPVRAVGHVPVGDRGSMPFMLVHGEPLVAVASYNLEDAGVELLDFNVSWADVVSLERPLVLHDPLCPLTPVDFLREVVEGADPHGEVVVVGVRPVTDTIKTAVGDVVGATVDREQLWAVASPVVLPVPVVAGLDTWPDMDDFAALVTSLRERYEVRFVEAPAEARRVDDESALRLLEALTTTAG